MTVDRKLEVEAVFAAIAWFVRTEGYSPTVRELAIELGVSVSTVAGALDELELAGRITRVPGKARTLRTVEEGGTA